MHSNILTPEQMERLKRPVEWSNLSDETALETRIKISRAQELGVVAVVFTERAVDNRIKELALLEHAQRNGDIDNTVYGVMLRGGNQFAVPFFRGMAMHSPAMNPQVDYMHLSRYGKTQVGGGLKIYRPLGPGTDFNGKHLSVIEDTVDEGETVDRTAKVATSEELCRQLGESITGPAKSVGVISLTNKGIARLQNLSEEDVTTGFMIPNAWAGGMGLDGPNEANRWIPELVITPVQDEKYYDIMPEILDTLGERAVMGMNDITWISSKKER